MEQTQTRAVYYSGQPFWPHERPGGNPQSDPQPVPYAVRCGEGWLPCREDGLLRDEEWEEIVRAKMARIAEAAMWAAVYPDGGAKDFAPPLKEVCTSMVRYIGAPSRPAAASFADWLTVR